MIVLSSAFSQKQRDEQQSQPKYQTEVLEQYAPLVADKRSSLPPGAVKETTSGPVASTS